MHTSFSSAVVQGSVGERLKKMQGLGGYVISMAHEPNMKEQLMLLKVNPQDAKVTCDVTQGLG